MTLSSGHGIAVAIRNTATLAMRQPCTHFLYFHTGEGGRLAEKGKGTTKSGGREKGGTTVNMVATYSTHVCNH